MKRIIEAYQASIRKIVKNITGSYNEDIEQEIYIKTWKNKDKYVEQNKFKQWISAIASNLCKDYLKSSKTKNDKNTTYDAEALVNVHDTKNSQEQLLEQKERQKIILREINKLPKKLKETIIYYELEEKSYEEISEIMNIPIGTIKSRLHSAREKLKETLSELL